MSLAQFAEEPDQEQRIAKLREEIKTWRQHHVDRRHAG